MTKFVDPYYCGQSKVNYKYDEEAKKIVKVQVEGWKTEFDSTERAWDEIRADLLATRREIEKGNLSTLSYYMKLRLLDSKTLSQEVGLFHFSTKRHLRSQQAWLRLNKEKKERYSKALDFPIKQLGRLPSPQELAQ